LLEDINLAGAQGILVNVTAGSDLSIGEFDEIGNTVKEFASDDATVVVGTVIDPDMTDNIRVTVVATGLGKPAGLQQAAMRVVRSETDAKEPNYAVLDKPTVQRRAVGDDLEESPETLEMLDIPAFLRRQVD
jgi:cell division protein FtsZ